VSRQDNPISGICCNVSNKSFHVIALSDLILPRVYWPVLLKINSLAPFDLTITKFYHILPCMVPKVLHSQDVAHRKSLRLRQRSEQLAKRTCYSEGLQQRGEMT
jgi:hypothetical protein